MLQENFWVIRRYLDPTFHFQFHRHYSLQWPIYLLFQARQGIRALEKPKWIFLDLSRRKPSWKADPSWECGASLLCPPQGIIAVLTLEAHSSGTAARSLRNSLFPRGIHSDLSTKVSQPSTVSSAGLQQPTLCSPWLKVRAGGVQGHQAATQGQSRSSHLLGCPLPAGHAVPSRTKVSAQKHCSHGIPTRDWCAP